MSANAATDELLTHFRRLERYLPSVTLGDSTYTIRLARHPAWIDADKLRAIRAFRCYKSLRMAKAESRCEYYHVGNVYFLMAFGLSLTIYRDW